MLGVTKAKKRLKRKVGITAVLKPFRFWTNQKRRMKRKVGYESQTGRLLRHGIPRPGGCLVWMAMGVIAASSAAGLAEVAWVFS